MFRVIGYITVVANPSDRTLYPFGPKSDIAGKKLQVLERNEDGDCLCLVNGGNGMADVIANDIVSFFPR